MARVGKYELVQKLATGGMAEVFLAKTVGPMGFEKAVVVKRILPHLVEEREFVEMFLSEAKLAAHLNHHNVVQIFDFGEADGAYFIAMELIDGPNLRVLSRRAQELDRPIPFPLCAKIIALACEGLAYAHGLTDPSSGEPLNLVHRDISPDNIMVTRTGGVKVVDFGIAKAASQVHRTGSGIVKGKLAYMPPEQLASKPLDRRADVYAIGVVLYNLITGAKPYDADSEISLMQAILYEAPVKARARRPEVPEELERIVEKAMERDVAQRYQDCLRMQADLERYLRTSDQAAGSPEIAAFVTEVAPPRAYTLGGGTPTKAEGTPPGRPEALAMPASPDQPAPEAKEAPEEQTEKWREASALASTGKKPERRGLRPVVGAVAGVVLLLGAGGYLMGHRSRSPADAGTAEVAAVQPTAIHEAASGRPDAGAELEPAPQPKATVFFRSNLPGKLRVDGKIIGRTPMQASDLPVGEVKVEVFGDDFSKKETFNLKPGDNGTKWLTIGSGTLELRVRPDAAVKVNGEKLGTTPLQPIKLNEGEHQVHLYDPGTGKTITRHVRIRAGEYLIYNCNLNTNRCNSNSE